MGYLKGFGDWRLKVANTSAFDYALSSGRAWRIHGTNGEVIVGRIVIDAPYTINVSADGEQDREVRKLDIGYLYPDGLSARVQPHIGRDADLATQPLSASKAPQERHHIKNRTLYVALMDKERLSFTLLGGAMLTGVLSTFTRYELALLLEPKLPVVVLRHAIHEATSAVGVNLLKSVQMREQAWKRSRYWIDEPPPQPESEQTT